MTVDAVPMQCGILNLKPTYRSRNTEKHYNVNLLSNKGLFSSVLCIVIGSFACWFFLKVFEVNNRSLIPWQTCNLVVFLLILDITQAFLEG